MADFITKIDDTVTEEYLREQLDPLRMPRHIAIIMDGNRRWAKQKGVPTFMGHREGAETFKQTMIITRQLEIPHLTVYAFSVENWKRSRDEINFIMSLFVEYCRKEQDLMKSIGARFHLIGREDLLTPEVRKSFDEITEYTKEGNNLIVNVAVNYSSRYEIFMGALKLAEDIKEGRVDPESLKEDDFGNYLYTTGQPDPDIMIRTSGELRVSNFLLWQNAYSEFWFTDVYWPDFSRKHMLQAIIDYQKRERRFGGGAAR
jgi:undecaprenyl diphosphate synthase